MHLNSRKSLLLFLLLLSRKIRAAAWAFHFYFKFYSPDFVVRCRSGWKIGKKTLFIIKLNTQQLKRLSNSVIYAVVSLRCCLQWLGLMDSSLTMRLGNLLQCLSDTIARRANVRIHRLEFVRAETAVRSWENEVGVRLNNWLQNQFQMSITLPCVAQLMLIGCGYYLKGGVLS